jgi:hypothetical protein
MLRFFGVLVFQSGRIDFDAYVGDTFNARGVCKMASLLQIVQ